MDTLKHLNYFYDILMELQSKTGTRILATCNIRMEWPQQGVYFFFEPGELRDNGKQMRVVRVGVSQSSESPRALYGIAYESTGEQSAVNFPEAGTTGCLISAIM